MSRYISLFNSNIDYAQNASTLEYPHVSLITGTGEIKYISFKLQELHDAPFLSKIVFDTQNEKIMWVDNDLYNTTDYPTNIFQPFGRCIYDAASRSDNNAVILLDEKPCYMNISSTVFNNLEFAEKTNGVYTSNSTTQAINKYFWDQIEDDNPPTFDFKTLNNQNTSSSVTHNYAEQYNCFAVAKNAVFLNVGKGNLYLPTVYDVKQDNITRDISSFTFMVFNRAYPSYQLIYSLKNSNIFESNFYLGNKTAYLIFYAGPEFN